MIKEGTMWSLPLFIVDLQASYYFSIWHSQTSGSCILLFQLARPAKATGQVVFMGKKVPTKS